MQSSSQNVAASEQWTMCHLNAQLAKDGCPLRYGFSCTELQADPYTVILSIWYKDKGSGFI